MLSHIEIAFHINACLCNLHTSGSVVKVSGSDMLFRGTIRWRGVHAIHFDNALHTLTKVTLKNSNDVLEIMISQRERL